MRILVTDAQELAGLGAIRSLGRAGHHVTAGFPSNLKRPGSTYSGYCSGQRIYPDPWASQLEFRQWLVRNSAEFDLVLPISEAALLAASCCRSEMTPSTKIAVPPGPSLKYTLSKRRATEKAIAIGIPCPATAISIKDAQRIPSPYLVRTDNRLMPDGSYKKGQTWYLEDSQELIELLLELDESGEEWVLQEYIGGKGAGAFLLRWGSQILLKFSHDRIHEVPFYGGWSSLRKSANHPTLIEAASKLLSSIGYQGVAMVEFRRSNNNRAAYFVEINGRLWGSLALALHAGIDFPRAMLECYTGSPPQPVTSDYPLGIVCRNVFPGEVGYLCSILKAKGKIRGVRPPSKVRAVFEFFGWFFSPRVRYDFFWPRDPMPWIWQSIHACVHVLRSQLQKVIVRVRRRRLLRTFYGKPQTAELDLRTVLFLCYGNICRSAFAEAVWNSSRRNIPSARSAGFHAGANRRSPASIRLLARRLGTELEDHRSKVIDTADIEEASAIFVMDGENIEDLLEAFPQARSKIWLLGSFVGVPEIRDPYLLPEIEAVQSLQQIMESVKTILHSNDRSPTGSGPQSAVNS